jgi:class 3 adenylate cyclase
VLVTAPLVAHFASSQRDTLRAEMRARARSLAGAVGRATSNELYDNNWAHLQMTVETLMDLDPSLVYAFVSDRRNADQVVAGAPADCLETFVPDVVRIEVTDAALALGRGGAADTAGGTAPEATGARGDAGGRALVTETWLLRRVAWRGEDRGDAGDRIIEAAVPVAFAEDVPEGTLRLGISERSVDRAIALAIAKALAFGIAALLAGLVGARLLARRITRPLLDLAARADRIRSGELDVEFPAPERGDEIALLSRTMGEMVHGLRDRDFIKDVFGRYVTPELAGELLRSRDRLKLGGHLQRVTMLMSDLRGFTSLSARIGPEGMVRLLNDYLGRMSEVILSEKGTIAEFIGDAVFALFGAPIERPDDALRACRAAILMQKALDRLNEENRAKGLPELAMGIGINTGEVVAGNIGSEHRVKYGVVGDAVNMTSRIEALTVGSQVLISEDTHREVAARVIAVGPREARVKGKAEPVRYHELRAIAGAPGLALAERAEERLFDAAIDVEVHPIRGKEVATEPLLGTARRISTRTVVVEVERPLDAHENVKLRLRLAADRWSGDVYAKAGEAEGAPAYGAAPTAGAGGAEGARLRVPLTITAIGDEDRALLERAVADAAQTLSRRLLLPVQQPEV